MFSPYGKRTELLRQRRRHKTRVVEKGPDVSFVSGVEDDRACRVLEIGSVDKIPHLVSSRIGTVVGEMVNGGIKPVLLWTR